jgi:chromosome segregation ATPase
MALVLVGGFLGTAAALTVEDRPIMKVVRMLQDMEAELKNELKDDKEVHEKITCWCNTNRKDKTSAIEMATAKIAQLEATIAEAVAKIAELKEKRAATLAEVNADHKALAEASELRIKENKQFQSEETDLIEAIMASKQAITALSKHHPELAQMKAIARRLTNARVPQLASNGLRREDLDVLKGFLQEASGSMSFLEIPGMKSYAPQSGQIFGILKQMQEDFEATLADTQKAEKKAVAEYETLKAAKEDEIAAGKAAIMQLDEDIAATTEKHAVATQELEDTEAQLALDQTFLANLEAKCAKSAAEFDQRVKDRLEEIAAVEDTIKILNSDEAFENFGKTVTDPNSAGFVAGTALLQVSEQTALEQKLRLSASAVLQRAGSVSGNPKLALLAASAKLDAFTKVKEEIDKLVAEYNQQQEDEIAHRDMCIADLNTNERDTAAADDKAAGLQAKIADLEKSIEGLNAELKATADANAEMQEQMKRASETREGESAANRQTVDDQRVTQMILGKATERMMATYQADKLSVQKMTATLLQGAPHTQTSATHTDPGNGPAAFSNNAEQNSGGNRVIAMLDEVAADSKKTEEETIASEEDAQTAYENFMKDSNKSIQHNLEMITNMNEARAKAKDSLSQAKTDLKQTMADLEALHETNGDLHKSCDFVLKNFDARQAARQAEIEAMKEAKNILSGMK